MNPASRGERSSSRRMRLQAECNTRPELALRRELHRRGFRYFVHRRPLPELRRTADLLFTSQRVAVMVHGCFWHGCAQHASWPKTNEAFWRSKIERNRARDADTRAALLRAGWRCVEVWEHESPTDAARTVATALGRGFS
jgi:DNA mismatch endonuclease (patch repair protein)